MAAAAVFFLWAFAGFTHLSIVSSWKQKGKKMLAFLGKCDMLYMENNFKKFGYIVNNII